MSVKLVAVVTLVLLIWACQSDDDTTPVDHFAGTLNGEPWAGTVRTFDSRSDGELLTIRFRVAVSRGDIIRESLSMNNLARMNGRTLLKPYPDSLFGHTFPTAQLLTTLTDGDVSGPGFELLDADSLNNYIEIVTIDDRGLSGNFGVTLVLENPAAFPDRSALDTIRIECAAFEAAF